MVASVVKSGLAQNFPDPPPPEDTNGPAARDPWANIFHPLPGARMGVPHPIEGDQGNIGMFDSEDGVYRCVDCMHEIWEGSCASCGRIYPGHEGDHFGDTDDEHDVAHMVDALRNGLVEGFYPVQHIFDVVDDYSGDDDRASEDSYDSSFIDDEENAQGHRNDHNHQNAHGPIIDLTSEGPSDTEDGEVRQLGRGWRHQSPAVLPPRQLSWASDDEDEGYAPRPAVRARRVRIIEDEDDIDSEA